MPAKKSPQNQLPTKVKAKAGTAGKTQAQKLKVSQTYLAAQAQSPVGTQIAQETAALKASRDTLLSRIQERANLRAQLDEKEIEVLTAEADHDTAIQDYAHEAANIAKDDPTVLQGLGVERALTHRGPRAARPADVPGKVRLMPGVDFGSARMKWTRPEGAGAFVAQYRIEEPPGVATTEWTPAEGFATSGVSWEIDGLPPAAHLRGRVRAIGAERGPWSEEVLGRAR
jgi:hypothetical protein